MKLVLMIVAAFSLAACGIETVGSAATAAALKKQEIEQGKKTIDQVQQKLDQATQQMQQRAEQTNEASEASK